MKIEMVREQLGTLIQITVVTSDELLARSAITAAFQECERIEKMYSRFLEGNELWNLNRRVGEWTSVNEEFYQLLCFAEEVKKKTQGAFDVTVKSILEGWGYDSNYSLMEGLPGQTGTVELEGGRVRISAPIELGGLGKGYALDRMLYMMSDFPHVHINAGGDVLVLGLNDEGKPWRLVFEDPVDKGKAIGTVDAASAGLALAASSPLRRQWRTRGKDLASSRDRHHLVDPRTGEPAQNMLAVYTQARAALVADTYSTALFVLGFEQSKQLLTGFGLPVEAMLVSPKREIFRSKGFCGELFSKDRMPLGL